MAPIWNADYIYRYDTELIASGNWFPTYKDGISNIENHPMTGDETGQGSPSLFMPVLTSSRHNSSLVIALEHSDLIAAASGSLKTGQKGIS